LRWVDISGRQDGAHAVFRDSRGRLTLVGRTDAPLPKRDSRFAAMRLLPDGRVDRSYGSNGRVVIDPTSQEDYLEAVARAPDGSVVMLGSRWGSPRPGGNPRLGYVLVRITPGGHVDRSFGSRGVVTGSFSSTAKNQDAVDVLVLPKGKIVILGFAISASGQERTVLKRLRADGRVDASFGSKGAVRIPGIMTGSILRQPGGKLVVAGGTRAGFRARRFQPDGRLDRSFGTNSLAKLNISGPRIDYTDRFRATQGVDGRIYVIGWAMDERMFHTDAIVGAFSSRGRAVTGFAGGGWTRLDYGNVDDLEAVKTLGDGRIIVAGSWWESLFDEESTEPGHAVISVLRPDGTLDPTFGTDGTVVTDLRHGSHPHGGDAAFLRGIVVAGGRITVAGSSGGTDYADFLAARYILTD
jgi:uncharacterized delta-60 repeat protein